MDLLNEESRFPKGTDRSLLDKLHNAHKVGVALHRLTISSLVLSSAGQQLLHQAQSQQHEVWHQALRWRCLLRGQRTLGEEQRHLSRRHAPGPQGHKVGVACL